MAACIQTTKGSAAVRKTRTWKTLKQIVAAERSLQWTADTALCELLSYSLIYYFLFICISILMAASHNLK